MRTLHRLTRVDRVLQFKRHFWFLTEYWKPPHQAIIERPSKKDASNFKIIFPDGREILIQLTTSRQKSRVRFLEKKHSAIVIICDRRRKPEDTGEWLTQQICQETHRDGKRNRFRIDFHKSRR